METNKTHDEQIQRFIQEALPKIKDFLKPNLVLLFGSRVKGTNSIDSDIDCLVVSDYFRGKPFLGRMPFMLRVAHFPWPIDFLCYSPEEFEKIQKDSMIVREAVKEGIAIILFVA